jgi:hypothetical protein
MKWRRALVVGLCVVVAACIAAAPAVRRSRSRGAQVHHAAPGTVIHKEAFVPAQMAVVQPDDAQPAWAVDVLSLETLNAQDQQLYQNMANILSGVAAIPNARTTFWSAVASNITGWGGSVSNVTPDGTGGYVVTVITSPNITLNTGESPTAAANYSEQWHVDAQNNATFVQSLDPDGHAGQPPALVVQ